MDYFGVIKKAYKVALKHKFLWIFGILAGGSVGIGSFNYQMPSGNFSDSWNKYSANNFADVDWTLFWANYGTIILIIMIFLALIAIVLFVMNLISQGALIGAAQKIESDQEVDFGDSFMIGWHNFWRIWGLSITLLLAILIALSVLILPVCALVISGAYTAAVIVAILLFLVNLLFWLLIAVISPYALRIVVLKKHSVFASIRESLHLVRDHWLDVLVMYLLLAAIGLAVGIALALAGVFLVAVLIAIGIGLYYVSAIVLFIYALLMILALIIVCMLFSGAYSTFTSSVITFTYLKLADKD